MRKVKSSDIKIKFKNISLAQVLVFKMLDSVLPTIKIRVNYQF